jgi:hypothetical protein
MSGLAAILRALAGLFVDDGALAAAALAIVALAAGFAGVLPGAPLVAGAVLVLGTLGALLISLALARTRSRPPV